MAHARQFVTNLRVNLLIAIAVIVSIIAVPLSVLAFLFVAQPQTAPPTSAMSGSASSAAPSPGGRFSEIDTDPFSRYCFQKSRLYFAFPTLEPPSAAQD